MVPIIGLGAKKPKKSDPSYAVAGERQKTKKQAGACFFKIMRRELRDQLLLNAVRSRLSCA
jgi:hypothetical protein